MTPQTESLLLCVTQQGTCQAVLDYAEPLAHREFLGALAHQVFRAFQVDRAIVVGLLNQLTAISNLNSAGNWSRRL